MSHQQIVQILHSIPGLLFELKALAVVHAQQCQQFGSPQRQGACTLLTAPVRARSAILSFVGRQIWQCSQANVVVCEDSYGSLVWLLQQNAACYTSSKCCYETDLQHLITDPIHVAC